MLPLSTRLANFLTWRPDFAAEPAVRSINTPDGVARNEAPLVAHATWIESRPSGVFVEPIVVPLRERELKIA